MRGAPFSPTMIPNAPRITPACAGSTTTSDISTNIDKDHPCLRGEYIRSSAPQASNPGSPLLARGVLFTEIITLLKKGITPACAGSTLFKIYKDRQR